MRIAPPAVSTTTGPPEPATLIPPPDVSARPLPLAIPSMAMPPLPQRRQPEQPASGRPDRLAALCMRTCVDHLERAHRIESTFATAFRQRPAWQIDASGQASLQNAGGAGGAGSAGGARSTSQAERGQP